MESNFRNRDFEQYVKQNADQYRMFPSEKVWKGIHGTLHTRRKWYGLGLALLLLSTVTAVTWVMVSYPVSDNKRITGVIPVQKPSATESATTQEVVDTKNIPFSIKEVIPATARRNQPAGNFTTSATNNDILLDGAIDAPGFLADAEAHNQKAQLHTVVTAPRIGTASHNIIPTPGPLTGKEEVATINDNPFMENNADAKNTAPAPSLTRANDEDFYSQTIESVTNEYKRKPRKMLDIQLYLTPTISYRKLAVNKSMDITAPNAIPSGNMATALSNMQDVNNFVTHKPDMGLQVGLQGGYAITKNIRARAGVQFNINRYDIKASLNNMVAAPYDLNAPGGNIEPMRIGTYLRNYNGSKSDWLKNYYFSVSMPIGVEMTLFGTDKASVGIAGTVQPTYIIKDRAYMISTDYKSYATIPWLTRKVNVSTGFEAFVNYVSGVTRWQIGPQVRYQILSSFHNKYPVKENLFDFGVKIGVSLNQ